MRSEVACGMYSVYRDMFCSSCSRPATKLEHSAGDAPNSVSSKNEWRLKLRIRPKYCSVETPGIDQL